ncbi:hypothetical protein HanHA300_Chr03g0098041 [Helianthus annuus]|nr:hypothetical protein HanHA300_Chr03g0098041 [Helianthus annuus]KAJ0768610.1 hypothetical protein HanLR1_Chr03g0103131 [Helianthus annuus]KAJ0774356.1 hypothetical protein HanOQP8_Chr03g0110621 [Helianthus annuus]
MLVLLTNSFGLGPLITDQRPLLGHILVTRFELQQQNVNTVFFSFSDHPCSRGSPPTKKTSHPLLSFSHLCQTRRIQSHLI